MIKCVNCTYHRNGECRRHAPLNVSINASNSDYRATWPKTDDNEECGDGDEDEINTRPPEGKYKVTNIYVDPDTGKCVVQYEII